MTWDDDYLVWLEDGVALWRLKDGDRFGPYMSIHTREEPKSEINLMYVDALFFLILRARMTVARALGKLDEAEDYMVHGGGECRVSLQGASGSETTTAADGQ